MYENKLPNSNTCCWRLINDNAEYSMYQYFVSTEYVFALDLSSHVLSGENDVGATFMSSMFLHATSIPIWIDKNDRIYLNGPKDMYNFAWGSNGTNKEKLN